MPKIVMTSARDIALDKLMASDLNVRRIKAGVSVEDLAEDMRTRRHFRMFRPMVESVAARRGRERAVALSAQETYIPTCRKTLWGSHDHSR